jgi:hypothetical protein
MAVAQGGVSAERTKDRPDVVARDKSGQEEPKRAEPVLGSISGVVVDPVGAVVPGTTITLLDKEGNHFRAVASNDEGAFELSSVPAGEWVLTFASPGFRLRRFEQTLKEGERAEIGNIDLNVGLVMGGAMVISVEYQGELAKAVYADDLEAATDLIARGADPNGREEDRTTPLFIAVENGNLDMVRLLVDAGAKVNARNKAKRTPIMGIDDDTSKELLDLLLAHGAKVDVTDANGNTPLIAALEGKARPEIISALLTARSRIDAQNNDGRTALMIAASSNNVEAVKLLLGAGANVHLKDNDGDTAWDCTGDEEIENLLVAHGYIVPQQEIEQDTVESPPPQL